MRTTVGCDRAHDPAGAVSPPELVDKGLSWGTCHRVGPAARDSSMVAHQCWAGDFRVGEFADAGWNLHNRESTQHGMTETEICMAQQVNVKFVDDLDGSDAAGTVSFALDGRAYEIDLSEDNAARLRDSLAAFIAAARKNGGASAAGGRRTPKMTATSGPQSQPLDREQTA